MDDTILYKALGVDVAVYWFNCAMQAGRKRSLRKIFSRRESHLLDLSDYRSRVNAAHDIGRRDVAIDDIKGSEGRQKDFDGSFYPVSDRIRKRWQSVARAYDQGVALPPVDLIQVGRAYFVRDGHHRISVARALGQSTISAHVTVWDVDEL